MSCFEINASGFNSSSETQNDRAAKHFFTGGKLAAGNGNPHQGGVFPKIPSSLSPSPPLSPFPLTLMCSHHRWTGSVCHWSPHDKYRWRSWRSHGTFRCSHTGWMHIRQCRSGSGDLRTRWHTDTDSLRSDLGRFLHWSKGLQKIACGMDSIQFNKSFLSPERIRLWLQEWLSNETKLHLPHP